MAKSLRERLPTVFPLHDETTDFWRWVEEHQVEAEALGTDLENIKKSLQIAHATGQSLDLIGADFGPLGRRRGRSDAAYRAYLQTLVQAFGGRGTSNDVEFAVSAGLVVPKSDVDVIEDFANNEYQLRIHSWPAHETGIIEEMADLADPPAIPLVYPVFYRSSAGVGVGVGDDVTSYGDTGMSDADLEPLSSGSWNLSDST